MELAIGTHNKLKKNFKDEVTWEGINVTIEEQTFGGFRNGLATVKSVYKKTEIPLKTFYEENLNKNLIN